jgi:cytochrome c biogenesis protein CcmG/thiol:disulfide interchange protein DsbE
MKLRNWMPFIVFLLIACVLWRGLKLHPGQIPSPLLNKAAPAFELMDLLTGTKVGTQQFQGHVSLFNVWATWCYACAQEHELLVALARSNDFVLYGLDYKDDAAKAKMWLREHGNPYQSIAFDKSGDVAIDWGVYGSPETFLIDKHGIVRYKQIGPITEDVWEQELQPRIEKLRKAP